MARTPPCLRAHRFLLPSCLLVLAWTGCVVSATAPLMHGATRTPLHVDDGHPDTAAAHTRHARRLRWLPPADVYTLPSTVTATLHSEAEVHAASDAPLDGAAHAHARRLLAFSALFNTSKLNKAAAPSDAPLLGRGPGTAMRSARMAHSLEADDDSFDMQRPVLGSSSSIGAEVWEEARDAMRSRPRAAMGRTPGGKEI